MLEYNWNNWTISFGPKAYTVDITLTRTFPSRYLLPEGKEVLGEIHWFHCRYYYHGVCLPLSRASKWRRILFTQCSGGWLVGSRRTDGKEKKACTTIRTRISEWVRDREKNKHSYDTKPRKTHLQNLHVCSLSVSLFSQNTYSSSFLCIVSPRRIFSLENKKRFKKKKKKGSGDKESEKRR